MMQGSESIVTAALESQFPYLKFRLWEHRDGTVCYRVYRYWRRHDQVNTGSHTGGPLGDLLLGKPSEFDKMARMNEQARIGDVLNSKYPALYLGYLTTTDGPLVSCYVRREWEGKIKDGEAIGNVPWGGKEMKQVLAQYQKDADFALKVGGFYCHECQRPHVKDVYAGFVMAAKFCLECAATPKVKALFAEASRPGFYD